MVSVIISITYSFLRLQYLTIEFGSNVSNYLIKNKRGMVQYT